MNNNERSATFVFIWLVWMLAFLLYFGAIFFLSVGEAKAQSNTCNNGDALVVNTGGSKNYQCIPLNQQPAGTGTTMIVANAGTTGTTINRLAKLTGAPSTAVITSTSDTENAVGIVTSGAGTTGNATITILGQATCDFDNATVAGDYFIISTITAGKCHDNGASFPTAAAAYGRVLSTNGASGAYVVELMTPDLAFQNAGNGKSRPGTPDTSVQFAASNQFSGNAAFEYDSSANTINLAQGSKTTSSPFINQSQTWNSAGTTFVNFLSNTTNTNSATGSLFFDWQLNSVSAFRLRKDGTNSTALDLADHVLAADGSVSRPSYSFTSETNSGLFFTGGSCVQMSVNGSSDVCFGRNATSFNQSRPFGFAGATISNDSMQAGFGFVANGQLEVLGTSAGTGGTLFSRDKTSSGSGAFSPNLAAGVNFERTLTGSQTFNAAANQQPGIIATVTIIQGGAGSFTVTWDSNWKFAGGVAPTLTTAAGSVDIIVFKSNGTIMREISRSLDVK